MLKGICFSRKPAYEQKRILSLWKGMGDSSIRAWNHFVKQMPDLNLGTRNPWLKMSKYICLLWWHSVSSGIGFGFKLCTCTYSLGAIIFTLQNEKKETSKNHSRLILILQSEESDNFLTFTYIAMECEFPVRFT